MKITAYALFPEPLPLRAAPPSRDWMDRIPDRHAYRCLPLAIANAHGWEVQCVCDFEATWDGGPHARNVQLRALDGFPNLAQYVVTHFAFGIITFHLTYLFRTEPGWNMVATGPANLPKAITAQLNETLNEVLRKPELNERLLALGVTGKAMTPEQVTAMLRTDIGKYATVIKQNHIRMD